MIKIMESSKFSALLLITILSVSSFAPALSCHTCGKPKPKHSKPKGKPVTNPPIKFPNLPVPPVTVPNVPLPNLPVPPVTVPNVPLPNLPVPPVTVPNVPLPNLPVVPPVTLPNLPLPPVTVPNVPLPNLPGTGTPAAGGKPCPPPPSGKMAKCPVDTLKLGACVDLLGGTAKVGLGDPVVNKCCPLLNGVVELEAAACLCTTLKLKALNLKVYAPVALQLLVTCGKTPPPGYTCNL